MIDLAKARIIAMQKLNEIQRSSKMELVFLEDFTLPFDYGWVFFYQSKDFVETGDKEKMVGGNAPILIDKYQGVALITGTKKDIKEYIRIYCEFKEAWKS